MVGHTNHTSLMTVLSSNPMLLLSKGIAAQDVHKQTDILIETLQIRKTQRGTFCSDSLQGSKEGLLQAVLQAQEAYHKQVRK